MSSISLPQCRIGAAIIRDLYRGRTFKSCTFLSHYFHTKISLTHATASFLAINTNDLHNLTYHRMMAGHAKWQNIKHVKEAKDRQKNMVCNKYSFLLRTAVREAGPDPKLNHKLAILMEQAKKFSVPLSVIENALKNARNNKNSKSGSIEILAPGGCVVVIEYETDNISAFRHELKAICKKYGANIMTGEGRWRAVFEKKGIIKAISQKDGQPLDVEKALDSAIEAGAEEVHTKEDENDKPYLEFMCAAEDLHPVKKEVERLYEVEEGYVGYIPITRLQVDKEALVLIDGFLEDLGNMAEIIRIFENAE